MTLRRQDFNVDFLFAFFKCRCDYCAHCKGAGDDRVPFSREWHGLDLRSV